MDRGPQDLRIPDAGPPVGGKRAFLDTTFLRHAGDLRGIPQVILQLVRLFLVRERFARVAFVATEEVYRRHLEPLGVGRDRVRLVDFPRGPAGRERFHGLGSTWRYRDIVREAALLIHPELRTVIRSAVPQAVVYYDFIIFEDARIRGRTKWSRYLWYRYKNRQAARVRYKIAISGHTRKRAGELFPGKAGADDIRVLHLGARAGLEGSAADKPFPPARLQFLYVGSFEARKNIDSLLEHLDEVAGDRPADVHLVGRVEGARRRELEARLAARRGGARAALHGLVTDERLAQLYRQSHFLLFPTLFEGFGLPMVEAMGYGTVVCAFDNSCIAEVGGGAILLAPDNDFAAWGKAVARLADDPAAYATMSRKARERAAHFSEAGMMERYGDYFTGILDSLGIP